MPLELMTKHGQPIGEKPILNEKSRSARFCIASNREDLEGDVLEVGGADFTDYRRNPVVCLEHNTKALVGVSESPDRLSTVEVRPELGKIYATCYFAKSALGEQTFELVDGGFLRGASIGFMPTKSAVRGKPRTKNGRPPLHIANFRVHEWSITVLPMNPDAVREVIERKFDGKNLDAVLVKALEPYAAELKAWSNGVNLATLGTEYPDMMSGFLSGKGFDPNEKRDENGKWTAGGGAKAPHEMTKSEWESPPHQDKWQKLHEEEYRKAGNSDPNSPAGRSASSRATERFFAAHPEHDRHQWTQRNGKFAHKLHVREALKAGKQVSAEVLADYPDLKGNKSMQRIQSVTIKADAFPDWASAQTYLKSYGYDVGDAPTRTSDTGSEFDFFPAENIADNSRVEAAIGEKALGTFGIDIKAQVPAPLVFTPEPVAANVEKAPTAEQLKAIVDECLSGLTSRVDALEKSQVTPVAKAPEPAREPTEEEKKLAGLHTQFAVAKATQAKLLESANTLAQRLTRGKV